MAQEPQRDLTTLALFCRMTGRTGGPVGKFYAERYCDADALQLFRDEMTSRERYAFCNVLVDNLHRIEDTANAQRFLRVNVETVEVRPVVVR